jgi:ribonucleoside-diphosphate reductase alpha chain
MCFVGHPEIFDFINAKTVEGRLDQFNISVIVNNEFLKKVEANADWNLKFAGKLYKTVKAREIWSLILKNMLEHAEPGLINWDNLVKNNSYYFSPIAGVNPCGELPLENYGVCNLGALNLPRFIVQKNVNLQRLAAVIRTAVRFLDNVIDLAYYPISQQESVVKNARRIGLGTMGLADYLFMKNLRYGSEDSLTEVERLYKFIRNEAYLASIELAKEKGAFPMYNKLDFTSASFVRKLPAKIRMEIKEYTIRNSTLLAAAPTGTTSLLAGVVGGIEPLPYKGYIRKDGVSERTYIHPLCKDNYDQPWFVDSYGLKPEDHLEIQTIIQKYVDSGVSKTIIMPEKAGAKKLSDLLLEYIYDLKGVTVYRDGSRKEEVYTRLNRKEVFERLEDASSEMDEIDQSCATGACEL